MKKKVVFSIVALMAITGGLTSCIKDEVTGEETITDLLGRSVEVTPGSYEKVVCIGAGALRLYTYINGANNIVGVEDIDNSEATGRPNMFDNVARPYYIAYGESFKNLPSCGVGGPIAQTIEGEKILKCEPDIVFSEYTNADNADALQKQLGVPVISLSYGSAGVFDSRLQSSLQLIGKVMGKESRATELVNYINSEKDEISTITSNDEAGSAKKVYICGLGNWGTTNHLMTVQNYEPFNVSHVTNVVNDLSINGVQAIESEKFVSLGIDTDIMIVDAAGVRKMKTAYADDNTIFDTIKAWQNGEVYLEMAYNAYYTNVEIALVNTWYYAKVVHPSKCSDLDIKDKLNEVTKEFLGKELADEIYAYTYSYGGYQKIDTATFLA